MLAVGPRRRRRTRRRPACAAGLLLALAWAADPAGAGPRDPLYQWTDAAGAVRYTSERERIPAAYRDTASRVELRRDGAAPPAAAPAEFREGPADEEALEAQPPDAPPAHTTAPEPAAGTDGR